MTISDTIETQILQILEAEGRIPNTDLAGRVGLSPSACLRRVQDLERRGVITGYRAVIDRRALGRGFTALILVGLNDHTTRSQDAFEREITRAPEVVECHNVTGAIEYVLRVECADLTEYKRFHADTLGRLAQVTSITTLVVMESPKDLRA